MDREQLEHIEGLFQAACDLSAAERPAFLDGECASPEERRHLETLLRHFDRDATLSLKEGTTWRLSDSEEGPGTTIGPYKLLQQIGEGGFGVVYMAEQLEPVRRKVALKIIKLGMDTHQVVARFEAERQALALMDHPSIARVFDAGTTESGRPFFVMELIRGVPITDYCDRHSLSTAERLALFVKVCHAVQHAHHKGLIHRDLKPSNVLVTLHDTQPVPKVIDFGIAKAIDQHLTEKTFFTEYHQILGTPAYMSPEQAEMSGLDIDTRADVYALGVLLYELLTGTTPFDKKTLLRAGFVEILRILREEEPPRPSMRSSALGEEAEETARLRRLEPAALTRLLRGDLDWIVMKTLEKDRVRRYESASSLAADIERYLADEPVAARSPSALYLFSKLLRRRRTAVLSTFALILLFFLGFFGTATGLVKARREQVRAEAEAARAQAFTRFLVDTLTLADPQESLESRLSATTLLQGAADRLDEDFAGKPQVEATVRKTIGQAYLSLGEYEFAERHLGRALEIYDTLGNTPPGPLYEVLWALTDATFKLERDIDRAFSLADRARSVGHAWIASTHSALAEHLDAFTAAARRHDIRTADQEFEFLVLYIEDVFTPGDPRWRIFADTLVDAGLTLWHSPTEAATERYYRSALVIKRRELPPSHPELGVTLSLLVGLLSRQGQLVEAKESIHESIDILRTVLPEGHWQIAVSESLLGEILTRQERFAEAESTLLATYKTIRTARGPTNFYTLEALNRLVGLYTAWERPAEARPYRELFQELTVGRQNIAPSPIP